MVPIPAKEETKRLRPQGSKMKLANASSKPELEHAGLSLQHSLNNRKFQFLDELPPEERAEAIAKMEKSLRKEDE